MTLQFVLKIYLLLATWSQVAVVMQAFLILKKIGF